LSEDFINQFRGSDYFRLEKFTDDYNELKRLVTEHKVQVGLMLPFNFSKQYQRGQTATCQALVDGTDSNTANIVLGYIQATGSMEGLMATPLKRTELLLGKLGPYFLIGMFDMAVVVGLGKFLFQVPLRGSLVLLTVMSAIFLIATLGQGLLISVTSENQLQAFQMAMLTTFLPSFLLSGFVFSIYLMPLPLQIASYIVPARYLVTISKGIYLKGLGLNYLWPSAVMLAGSATFFVVMSIKKFVKKIR
jgi:ABC-type multidrug transport system permease subunit